MKDCKENNKSNPKKDPSNRREMLRLGLLAGGAALTGGGISRLLGDPGKTEGAKVKVLTADGKLIEVPEKQTKSCCDGEFKIREGVPGKKFVMVIDLARCGNKRTCIEACQKMHNVLPPIEYIKVKRMQDSELARPYWFPQLCYQCDNPPCTKVCPVDATFKRSDGIVAVDP